MQAREEEQVPSLSRIHPRFRPVWEGRSAREQRALSSYFLPHRSKKDLLGPTRPRLVKWYCPFADQHDFRSGHRYCINVYTGCDHRCAYCYAASYQPERAAPKPNFEKLLTRDLADLERFDVPAAPVHLSNSTDPFQPRERELGHTRLALQGVLESRERFTTVTVLTKDPLFAAEPDYAGLFRELMALPAGHSRRESFEAQGVPGFQVEVSIAFRREEARRAFDPGAPPIESRREGVRRLREAGVPVVLRIDPLFPRSSPGGLTLEEFGLVEAQPLEDLEDLVAFAAEVGARHVAYSVGKIVLPRGKKLPDVMRRMKRAYGRLARPGKLEWRGGSWRLPWPVARRAIVSPFLEICARRGVEAKYCKQNLVETP